MTPFKKTPVDEVPSLVLAHRLEEQLARNKVYREKCVQAKRLHPDFAARENALDAEAIRRLRSLPA